MIRAGILRGELDAHRRLTEGYFAAQFQISKSPIREALNRLEAEGLIVIVPRRGAYVRDLSTHDTEEIYELREILESWAVRHTKLNAGTIARLRENVTEAEACLARNDREKYVSLDASFHRILAESNPNSRLRKFLESMHDQMLMLRHRTFALSSQNSVSQHRGIVEALERGNRAEAARLMTEHIRAVRKRLLREMKSSKPGGEVGAAAPARAVRHNKLPAVPV